MAKTKVTGGYIADGAITSDHLHTTLDLSSKTLTIGATTVSGHLIPDTNITYDLGSSTYRFRDIYLDGNTIDLGGTELKKNDAGDIEFKSGSNFKKLVISELEFDDGTNRKKIKIDSGKIKTFDSSGASDTADKISLAANKTDDLGEGTTNLYFTTARARSSFSASTGIAITDGAISAAAVPNSSLTNSSVTINSNSLSLGGTLTLDTDDIGEGSTNLYFTNARARGAISVSGNALSYDSSTGVLTASYEESPTFTGNVTASNLSVTSTNWIGFGDYGERISGSNAASTLTFYTNSTQALQLDSSQNATFAGTVQATSFSDGTISGITFIDEDSFATNSATRVPTQQSIKAYVDAQVAGVVDSAPAALNTLNELAAALGDDANFATTTSTALGYRLRVDTAAQGLTGTQQDNAITNLGITATKAELNYVDGVTSNIQTQLDAKQASGSYLTGNQTITLSGDVSGSGTTSIVVTVADDSHNHIIGNVDGLQAALDAKAPLSAPDFTGEVYTNASQDAWAFRSTTGATSNSSGLWFTGTTARLLLRDSSGSIKTSISANGTNSDNIINGNTIWHAGNDGAGSGLDADLLDGKQPPTNWAATSQTYTTIASASWDLPTGSSVFSKADSSGGPGTDGYWFVTGRRDTGGGYSGIYTPHNDGKFYAGYSLTDSNPTWYEVWTSGSDGAGSGLDADLLDGQHGSYYQAASTALTTSTSFGGDVSGTYGAIVVADDSHNHIISNVDGLQAALDGKLTSSSGLNATNLTSGTVALARLPSVLSPSNATELGSGTDLDSLTASSAGFYYQTANADTTGNNYPSNEAGSLIVQKSAGQATQLYQTYTSSPPKLFFRSNYTSGYGTWERVFSDSYHPNADKWTAAKTLTLGGDLTGNVSFDGSANFTLTAAVVDDSHNHIISNIDGLQTALDAKLASSSYTAADVLTKIKTVDGAGSGLDADLIDNIPSTSLVYGTAGAASNSASATQSLTELAQYKSGFWDTTSASWTPTTDWYWGATFAHRSNSSSYNYAGQIAFKNGGGGDNVYLRGIAGGASPSGTTWRKIWTDGNDGSGSGLNADLLDGVEATGFLYRDVTNSGYNINLTTDAGSAAGLYVENSSNQFRFQLYGDGSNYGFLDGKWAGWDLQKAIGGNLKVDHGGTLYTVWDAYNDGSGSGLDADLLDGLDKNFVMHYKGVVSGNWDTIFSQTDGHMGVYEVQNIGGGSHSNYPTSAYTYGGVLSWQLDNATFKLYAPHTGQLHYQTGWNNDEYSGWRKLWDSGNDGSGSGLDADTVDGIEASGFVNQNGTYTLASGYSVAQGDWGLRNSTPYGWIQFGPANTSHAHIYTDRSNFYFNVTSLYASGNTMWHAGNDGAGSGLDADNLDGRTWSESVVANTIVSRQANGYIYANHINFNTSESENPSINSFFVSNGDGWSRKATKDHVRSQLGLVWGSSGKGTTNIAFGSTANSDSGFYDVYNNGTPTGTWYSLLNMAHYGGNHGHQIAGSFYSHDLYHRYNSNGTLGSWSRIWSSLCDGSGSGLDADLLDGLELHTSRNNEVNKVVRTDSNGYIQAGWINTTSGQHSGTITKIYASDDGYIRYVTPAHLTSNLGLVGSHNGNNRAVQAEVGALHFYADGGDSGQSNHAYALYQQSGGWSGPYPDLFVAYHTGISFGANSGYDGMRFFTDYNMSSRVLQVNGSSNYIFKDVWMNTPGNGIYSSVNGAHLEPNQSSTYAAWRITGSRNSYGGIYDSYSGVAYMFDSAGNGGWYREAQGRWYTYHNLSNNCLGIGGSTTSSSYGLYEQAGGIYSSGNITAYSDRRVKENIVPIDNALEKVNALQGVYYNRIDDEEKKKEIGFIAQDVNEVTPELVTYAEDIDQYGVKYGNTTALLVEAIKELTQKVKELEKKLEEK